MLNTDHVRHKALTLFFIKQQNKVSVIKAPKKQLALARKTKKNVVNILDFKKKSVSAKVIVNA